MRATIMPSCLVLALLLGLLAGCERSESDQELDYSIATTDADSDETTLRIVSLAPALSRILVDLGMGSSIVGIAEFDSAAPPGLPVVGSYLNVNAEAMINLKPTHVLLMTDQHGIPDSLRNYAESIGFELVTYPYPYKISDVASMIFDPRELPGVNESPVRPSLGSLFAGPSSALVLANRIGMQLGTISRIVSKQPRPNVLLVIGIQPQVMASAPGNTGSVLNDALGFAGGLNVAADATISAPTYDRESLLKLQPQVVLLLLPGEPPITSPDTDSRLAAFRGLDIPAARDGRIHLINDPQVLLPASNIAHVTSLLAKALHPSVANQIDKIMAANPADLARNAAAASSQPESSQPGAHVSP
jgi:iron complex transport system substrate-binding protein